MACYQVALLAKMEHNTRDVRARECADLTELLALADDFARAYLD